jgi:peroxiredoxin
LQLQMERMRELGASLVAVSPQTPDSSLSTMERNYLEFEVLSDLGNRLAREFGIVFELPSELRPIYASYGLDLLSVNADDTFELPLTATYVIDRSRKIRFAFVDTDYTKRMEPEEIVTALSEMNK